MLLTKEQIDIVKDILVLEMKGDTTYLFVSIIESEDNANSYKAKEIALNFLSDKGI